MSGTAVPGTGLVPVTRHRSAKEDLSRGRKPHTGLTPRVHVVLHFVVTVRFLARTRHRAQDSRIGAPMFVHPETGEPLSHNVKIGLILNEACKRTGVPTMRVHDLRHAYASLWLMAGGSLTDLQRNLGHSTPVITSLIYGHLTEDHRVGEADRCFPVDHSAPSEGAGLALVGEPVKGGRP
jgi:integrase